MSEYGLQSKNTWMIGNSLRSDIKPALEKGLRCIWLNTQSWEYDKTPISFDGIWIATCLRDVLMILRYSIVQLPLLDG